MIKYFLFLEVTMLFIVFLSIFSYFKLNKIENKIDDVIEHILDEMGE
jgi:F0F1-type ATP synthase membrane subunit b/b'